MTEKILFPIDFSPSCVGMAAYVKRAAEMFSADVTLLYVADLNSYNGFEIYARPPEDIAEEHWRLRRNQLEHFLTSEFPATKCHRVLVAGDPASVIAETARKNKFDLIMMPTHAGRFRRMVLGSTTAKVLRGTDCPVLTTLHAETVAPQSLEHRTWACAVGLSSDSERVLRYAKDAALAAGAKLLVIHAIEAGKAEAESHEPSEEELRARQGLAELQSRVGADASLRIALGPVKETLLDHVRQTSADVLVIGRSLHGAPGRLGDLTYSLVRDAPCPVVSV